MSKNSRRQKRANKTAYSHKLYRFLRELQSFTESPCKDYFQFRQNLYKKYGFTEKDWGKAIHNTMSISNKNCNWDGIGYKKYIQICKDCVSKKLERDLHSGKQDHLNKIGEEEIQNEDRWIADVFDTYDYDEEDMQR